MKENINHPRIKSVMHTFTGKEEWEQVLQKIIINYLKDAKRLD